jgi:hypothetical protein
MRNRSRNGLAFLTGLIVLGNIMACSDDNSGLTPAQRHGVGAACAKDADCFVGDTALKCLSFKGGYCGLEGCQADAGCPPGSGCVAHDDGNTYCFLLCASKPECNYTRPLETQSNCASNVNFVDRQKTNKACVPPS